MKNLSFVLSLCATMFLLVVLVIMVGGCYNPDVKTKADSHGFTDVSPILQESQNTIYDFELPGLDDGTIIKLADFKNKVILIVNTAAKCGFAPQYKDLEKIHECYKDQGLVVIGVSSADFGQEVGDHVERACSIEDHVKTTFLMTDTVHVTDSKKDGYEAIPLYKWLNAEGAKKNSTFGSVTWNFHKFLIGKDGQFIDYFAATTKPTSKKVIKAIEKALKA
jgi:glutathione peroxidase